METNDLFEKVWYYRIKLLYKKNLLLLCLKNYLLHKENLKIIDFKQKELYQKNTN